MQEHISAGDDGGDHQTERLQQCNEGIVLLAVNAEKERRGIKGYGEEADNGEDLHVFTALVIPHGQENVSQTGDEGVKNERREAAQGGDEVNGQRKDGPYEKGEGGFDENDSRKNLVESLAVVAIDGHIAHGRNIEAEMDEKGEQGYDGLGKDDRPVTLLAHDAEEVG